MDVRSVLALLRRRWLAVVLCLIAGLGGAGLVTMRAVPQYQSSARLFVNIPRAGSVAEQVQGVQLTVQLLLSYSQIATSRSATEEVARRLGRAPHELGGTVAATPVTETLLIDVVATAHSAPEAATLANVAADVLTSTIADLERGKASPVTARVVDRALPIATPISPRPKVNYAVGGVVGLAFGLLLAFALDAIDRSLKLPAQASESFRAPLLAATPRSKDVRSKPVPDDALSPVSEAFRTLRTAIRFVNPDSPLQVILVTSAIAGEGKTTTAVNLAAALAQSGERVLLVDGDLRRARLAEMLNLEPAVGLTSVITNRVPVEDAIQAWHGVGVLTSGVLPPNPSEILGSEAMAGLVDRLRVLCDVVVFDAPPVLPVTDAVVLSTQCDGVVLVARHGKTQKAQAAEARRRLDAVGANVVGCVLNAVPASATHGYYEEYYGRRPESTQWGRRLTDRVSR
ncbi:MAG TPA: polysaccharide biosynthesis tyrosine autokinase [Frankiaceae bacterium]|nr:polysaccharide biosynthesis tyrosine autokinase [Frankiaceae bacterium]